MKYSYIYFDIAGTLLFKEHLFETIQSSLSKEGFSVPIDVLREYHTIVSGLVPSPSTTTKEFYNVFNAAFLHSLGIVPYPKIIDSMYNNCRMLQWKVYDDVIVLNSLEVRKGVISNWDETLGKKLNDLFPAMFDLVHCSAKEGIKKPSKVFYEQAFADTKLPASQIVYIGDSIILDMEPALSLGVNAILIDRESRYPWYRGVRIRSLQELHDVLQT